MSDTTEQIRQQVRTVIHEFESSNVIIIDPRIVTDETLSRLDPDRVTQGNAEVWHLATLQLRQLVGRECSKMDIFQKAEEVASGKKQFDLFGLQDRYPIKIAKNEFIYKHIDHLAETEMLEICERLETTGGALIKHARALETYFYDRQDKTISKALTE